MDKKVYNVAEFSLGEKNSGDRIVFNSIEDLEKASKDLDNARDVYVRLSGIITRIPHRTISTKVYEGSLRLSAMDTQSETIDKGE